MYPFYKLPAEAKSTPPKPVKAVPIIILFCPPIPSKKKPTMPQAAPINLIIIPSSDVAFFFILSSFLFSSKIDCYANNC